MCYDALIWDNYYLGSKYLWEDLGLDVVGVSAYFPLSETAPNTLLSISDLELKWDQIFKEYLEPLKNRNPTKPIVFLEYGYTDSVKSPYIPNSEEFIQKLFIDQDGNGLDDGEETQANIYQALFNVMNNNADILKGAFLWGHMMMDNNEWDNSFANMRGFHVRSKLSEEIVRSQYKKWTPLDEQDTDADGTPDVSDACPNDPNKTEPGECGCGVAEGTCQMSETIDGGSVVASDLWLKAVLQVSGNPVTLVWQEVGADLTPSGDQVISGYFYADPADFSYGSQYNPEVFVKVYIAKSGWANMAFNHVTVDPVTVYSAHRYDGTADQTSSTTLDNRLVQHEYTGVAIDTTKQSTGGASTAASGSGYTLGSNLWSQAILQVTNNPVTLIWKEVGTDTTPAGAKVISGYFYADPADFAYGSAFNPEVFVKVYIDPSGWSNMAFNHVTVDPVGIESAHGYAGSAQKSGSVTLNGRLVEHSYTGVSLQ